MELPLKVLNRLRPGNDIAARVQGVREDRLAWVYIFPIVSAEYQHNIFNDIRYTWSANKPIRCFFVRYVEVEKHIMDDYRTGKLHECDYPTEESLYFVTDEAELFALLNKWSPNLGDFREPNVAGYWLNFGTALVSQLCEDQGIILRDDLVMNLVEICEKRFHREERLLEEREAV